MNHIIDNIKFQLWRLIYGPIFSWRYWRCRQVRRSFHVLNSYDTIKFIVNNRCSVSRFGDGELAMIYHFLDGGNASNFYIDSFQSYSEKLAEKLYRILLTNNSNLLVSIPYPIVSVDEYKGLDKIFWQRFTILDINRFKTLLSDKQVYGNSCFTRFYLNHKKTDFNYYVSTLKGIWEKLNICVIEGENSRLGVRNDLFANAKSIHRILCPTINAFEKYDKILSVIEANARYDLYLIALGHTATVLASDLSELGLWAIDIGHIDIEYEWYLRRAKRKIVIPDKYINEIDEGRKIINCSDITYEHEIIARV
ncbi:MAG: GT-D fold domain-containing glycosyltransferase [Paraprevotella sp.]|nr:GT-D fold domain-containing glycosyltransferase [Paraprevotella sp.]